MRLHKTGTISQTLISILGLLQVSCAGHFAAQVFRAYEGPELEPQGLSILVQFEDGVIEIESVDGTPGRFTRREENKGPYKEMLQGYFASDKIGALLQIAVLEIKPGPHTIQLRSSKTRFVEYGYRSRTTFWAADARVSERLDAIVGHVYLLRYEEVDSQTGEGKTIKPILQDITNSREKIWY